MRRLLSKESFADLAQQAAGALRRIVSSADNRSSRDALSPSSQVVVTACKTNTQIGRQVLEAWVADVVEELELQAASAESTSAATPSPAVADATATTTTAATTTTNTAEDATDPAAPSTAGAASPSSASLSSSSPVVEAKARSEGWKPLSESALMVNLEGARVLMFSVNAAEACSVYHEKKLVPALLRFYGCPGLSQKLRDCCALVVVGVCSSRMELLRDCLRACWHTLHDPPSTYGGRVLRVLLASLLVEVLHQFHISGARSSSNSNSSSSSSREDEFTERGVLYCKNLMDALFQSASQWRPLQQETTTPPTRVASPKSEVSAGGGVFPASAVLPSSPTRPAAPPASPSGLTPPAAAAGATLLVSPPTVTAAAAPFAGESANSNTTAAAAAGALAGGPTNSSSSNGAANANSASDSLAFASSVVFLAVLGGLYRSVPSLKVYFVRTYGADYTQLWARLAASLPQMQTTFHLPCATSKATVTATLEPVEYWRSEMLESMVELCTEDSFTNQRAIAMMSLSGTGSSSGTTATAAAASAAANNSARRATSRSTAKTTALPAGLPSAAGGYQYDPIPVDWETYLSSGKPSVWRLASALYVCAITPDGASILKAVLLQLNTRYASAEALYRWVVCTLTLLCVANPRNAVLLTEHNMLRTLIALVNCNQPSVFPASEDVVLWSHAADGATPPPPPSASSASSFSSSSPADQRSAPTKVTLSLTPPHTLNVNTTQLTFSFLDTLTSTTFSRRAVEMLRGGIQDMYTVPSSQTDVDVVENLLSGLCRAFIPHPLLFFPGDGYVTWRLKQLYPRGSGYSFSAWILPTCVWGGGSCLYSFMDQSDTRVSILVVADGRLCFLAVRVNKAGGDPLEFVMADAAFAASQWTHVVVTHGVALNVYINGRRLESVHEVPYPKEKHPLTFTMGGAAQLPGFFGYTSGLTISPTLSEKEIARLYAAGPTLYEPARDCAAILAPRFTETSGGREAGSSGGEAPTSLPSPSATAAAAAAAATLQQHEVLAKRSSEFSWHHVELYTPTDVEELMTPKRVLEWVLGVLRARETAPTPSTSTTAFTNVAKLCISLLSTAMQLASNEELTSLVHRSYLDRLRTEVLSWKTTFPEFASLMLQSTAARGGVGRALRQHACTQRVIDILLSCVMQTSARNRELMERSVNGSDDSAVPSSRVTASASPPPPLPLPLPHVRSSSLQTVSAQETNATNIILRELSDCLLVSENLKLFQEDPRRFQSILSAALYLPKECIKSVVILIEKLCRGEAELRQVFFFLFTPSTASPTVDTAKVRVLRMLFDIAQEDVAMCEMIQECFKGRGFAFVLLLVSGQNHASEAIRVLALGLLSLLMPLKGCAKFFKKYDGFDVLSMAITEPRSPIPLGIRTFDALIQVAFDEFRRRKERKPEADGIAMRLMAAAHLSHRTKQRESASNTSLSTPPSTTTAPPMVQRPPRRTAEYRGHTPPVAVNQLGTRRGYSFEHTHDYGKVNEDFGELMILHKGSRYHSLELPLALKTVLCALEYLIRTLVLRLPSPASTTSTTGVARVTSGEYGATTALGAEHPGSPLPRPESGMMLSGMTGASATMADEHVVIEVLNYLSKVIDYPKHALKLMDIQWLGGLWVAVRVFFEKPSEAPAAAAAASASDVRSLPSRTTSHGNGSMRGDAFESGARRLHQERAEFVSDVKQRTCTIIRKMVILDISSNERAQVRSIRDADCPPRLVRIVLEEIARHFCVQKNGELGDNASNVIRNLNALFKDVHTALTPFPPSLGVAIVMAITNISVSSSTQVRRRMKNSSNLLVIRDNLAFYVLRESRRFLRLRRRSLNQLIDINVNNANSMTVLLHHLSGSIKDNSVNEVEVLVSLIQQLAGADPARVRELHNVVGENRDVVELKDILSSSSSSGGIGGGGSAGMGFAMSPLQATAYASMPSPSDRAMSEAFTDVDSNGGGITGTGVGERGHRGTAYGLGHNPLEDDTEPGTGALTAQLLEWCQTHPDAWAAVQRNIQAAMSGLALDRKDEKREERSSFFGGGGSSGGAVMGGQSPKAGSGGGLVGLSERGRREFQQIRAEVEEELAKASASFAAASSSHSSGGH